MASQELNAYIKHAKGVEVHCRSQKWLARIPRNNLKRFEETKSAGFKLNQWVDSNQGFLQSFPFTNSMNRISILLTWCTVLALQTLEHKKSRMPTGQQGVLKPSQRGICWARTSPFGRETLASCTYQLVSFHMIRRGCGCFLLVIARGYSHWSILSTVLDMLDPSYCESTYVTGSAFESQG